MNQVMEIKKRSALSGWPMLLAWSAMLIFAFHASTHMVGAGDTWVAMACGRHFLNHGVDTVEPFSANSHKAGPTEEEIENWPEWAQWITSKVGIKTVKFLHPTGWVNQNWLTHVIFYWLTHESPFADAETLSYNTVVYWKFAVYIITVICIYYTGRLLGVNPALSALFACFAMFVGRSFFDVRPAGFSNLLVAVFLLILVLTTYRNVLYIWLVVPVTVFWCNVHGGYIYAFIMLVPFVVLNLLTSFSKKRFVSIGLKGTYHTIAAGFVTLLAAIIFNPFHLTNFTHTFLISVSRHAKMWRTVNEWHPGFKWDNPVGTGFPFLVLYILCIGLPVFWLYSRYLKPRFLKAPKNELEQQRKLFIGMSKISGWAVAVFICWVVFISFSFLNLYLPGPDGRYGTNARTGINDDILDVVSLLICAVFVAILLLSIFKNAHFIYLEVPLILLALWLVNNQSGYVGRYFYPFVLLPTYVILHIFASLFSKNVKSKPWNIGFVVATAIVAFVLMTPIFNPLKFGRLFTINLNFQSDLDNGIVSGQLRREFQKRNIQLSETAAVSVEKPGSRWLITDEPKKYSVRREQRRLHVYKPGSPFRHMKKEIFHLRRKWVPQYEGKYKLRYAHLFTVIYIINIISVILWLAFPYLRSLFRRLPGRIDEESQVDSYQLPKIDLALMVIAALTVYMAYRSRRFIPIAAIAACPILAMFIDQMARTISASHSFHGLRLSGSSQNSATRKKNRLVVPPMPYSLQVFFVVVGAVAVLGFGTWWGLKFKCVYLDPWPTDPKLSSVFMRMTASDAKPFYALRFIKNNKLEGKMFNYWTEGGFIAYGQQPDPNTGKTPLQLFMDGRAQAAYEPVIYKRWSDIMAGGSLARQKTDNARARGRGLSSADYKEIGDWINKQFKLKKHNVWAVLMPANQFGSVLVRGLERNPDWRLVFFNNKQKLFVDITTKRGDELFNGIFNEQTIYPDDFSKKLNLAHNKLLIASRLESQKQQIEKIRKTTRAKLDNENNILRAKEKTAAQFTEKLDDLSEQLRTVQERLNLATEKGKLELEEMEKQKHQIEKEIKAVEAKLDSENTIIKVKEKTVAQFRRELAELSEQLTIIQNRLKNAKNQGLELAIQAFELNPSNASIQKIIFADRFTELKPAVIKSCKDYLDKFIKNKDSWTKKDGYHHRIVAALNAATYLRRIARSQRNAERVRFYSEKIEEYSSKRKEVVATKRW
jgi:hypothetical protein